MRFSIITIAYNSQDDIVKTIESVLGQTYSDIEYLIIDGASQDRTIEVAEKYSKRFCEKGVVYRLYSEPDNGIYDAMNKGIRLATGDVIGILNSGDWYEKETLQTVEEAFTKEDPGLLFGNIRIMKQDGKNFVKKAKLRKFQTSRDWNHPTMFVKSELYKDNLFPCKGLHDDYGFYLKMHNKGTKIVVLDKVLANFTMGGASNQKSLRIAIQRIKDRYYGCYRVNGYSRWYLLECIAIEAAKWILG